ncbi:MAG: hypothetical protein AUJ92_16535 [Armatimonadetes bacterium CG2_30_59_28]|nr:MAG: hypothetical protein AUJ92_16535 [Armatimonadetes bacterium CG2_30_59_28]PIU64553.1 MAG: hypothetical protein COS85_12045 [Armatimonadetes bacterium CG07_land_8_20_14_0_80_59_28]
MAKRTEVQTTEELNQHEKLLEETICLMGELRADVEEEKKLLDAQPDRQPRRRTYVRTLFAWVEGCTHIMRQYVVNRATATDCIFAFCDLQSDADQLRWLKDERKPDGNIVHLAVKDAIRLSLKCYAKATGSGFEFTFDRGNGWQALVKSIKARDRITHPKCHKAILVDDDELKDMEVWRQWLMEELGALAEKMRPNPPTFRGRHAVHKRTRRLVQP